MRLFRRASYACKAAHIYPTAGRTQRGRSRGLDIDVETLAKGTVLEASIHVPTELLEERNTAFDERRRKELGQWEKNADWLSDLAAAGREQARQILTDEITFYQSRADVPCVHYFYNQVVERFSQLKANEMILVIGWGGGWHTKTTEPASQDRQPAAFERIVSRYRLNPTGKRNAWAIPSPRAAICCVEQMGSRAKHWGGVW